MVGAGEGEQFFRKDGKPWAAEDDRRHDGFPDPSDKALRDLPVSLPGDGVAVVQVPQGDADVVGSEAGDLLPEKRLRFARGQKVELLHLVAGFGEPRGHDGEAQRIDLEGLPADVGRYEENPLHGRFAGFGKDLSRRGL